MPLVSEMLLCRIVDNFLIYVTELMTLIFRTKPETLKSSKENVTFEFVLEHVALQDLVDAMVDRRVNELSYRGMRALSEYLGRNLGFDLFPDETKLARAVTLVEMRNLVVHNRGIINKTFLSRVSGTSHIVDTRLEISQALADEAFQFLQESVADIDERSAKKFALPGARKPEIKLLLGNL